MKESEGGSREENGGAGRERRKKGSSDGLREREVKK